MDNVSVIIITKNEVANIANCIECARLISNNIIVIDSGSTDETVKIAKRCGAEIIVVPWQGYGFARNSGAKIALHDWILAIDADERVTEKLANEIKEISNVDASVVYGFRRENYYLGKHIKFGEWGRDKVYRLYNRNKVTWDLSPVHEDLMGQNIVKKVLKSKAKHFTVITHEQDIEKVNRYALLSAEKLYKQNKKSTFIKRFLSPVFNFLQSYVLRLGFLDGKPGLMIAISTMRYVWLKNKILYGFNKNNGALVD